MIGKKLYKILVAFLVCFAGCVILLNTTVSALDKDQVVKNKSNKYTIDLSKCIEALQDEGKDASDRCRYCLKSLKKQQKEFKKLHKEQEIPDADYSTLKTELDSKIKKVEELELRYNKSFGSILFEQPTMGIRIDSPTTTKTQLYNFKKTIDKNEKKQEKKQQEAETSQGNN